MSLFEKPQKSESKLPPDQQEKLAEIVSRLEDLKKKFAAHQRRPSMSNEELEKIKEEVKGLIREKNKLEGKKELPEEAEAKELVEKLGGIFLGTKEIKEAFSTYDEESERVDSLIPDKLPEIELPSKERIEKIAETFKKLGYTKWGLVRLVSKDKNGQDINIDWLNKHYKTDPKDPDINLICQKWSITSDDKVDIKMRAEAVEDKWVVIALDCAKKSATTNKSDREQQKLVDKINKEKDLNLYTPKANADLYSVLATYLTTGQKLRHDPLTWLRSASRSAGLAVFVGDFDLWVTRWGRGRRYDNVGRALAGV